MSQVEKLVMRIGEVEVELYQSSGRLMLGVRWLDTGALVAMDKEQAKAVQDMVSAFLQGPPAPMVFDDPQSNFTGWSLTRKKEHSEKLIRWYRETFPLRG